MKKRLEQRGWISEIILQSASFVLSLGLVVAPAVSAHGQTFTVLHTFTGAPDGANPLYGPSLRGRAGNFYGTTINGGAFGYGTSLCLPGMSVKVQLSSQAFRLHLRCHSKSE